jgi:hypothetical protein
MYTGISTILELHDGPIYETTASIDLSPGLILAPTNVAITKLYGNLGCNVKLNDAEFIVSVLVVCGGIYDNVSSKPVYPAGSLVKIAAVSPGDVFWGRVDGTVVTRGQYLAGSQTFPGRVYIAASFKWPLIALTNQLEAVTDSFVKMMMI